MSDRSIRMHSDRLKLKGVAWGRCYGCMRRVIAKTFLKSTAVKQARLSELARCRSTNNSGENVQRRQLPRSGATSAPAFCP